MWECERDVGGDSGLWEGRVDCERVGWTVRG